MNSSLVHGKYLISAPSSAEVRVIEDGAVYQSDGRIVDVGNYGLLRAKYPDVPVIGSHGDVVMPGLVNAHHHVGLTPFQLGSPDLPLELWRISRLGARAVDPYLDTLYSAFELVSSGVTTVQHIETRTKGHYGGSTAFVDEVLRAYSDIGMRVSFGFALREQSLLVYGDDSSFVDGLPSLLRQSAGEVLAGQCMPLRDQLEVFFTGLRGKWDGERVRVQLAPGNYHWLSDSGLEEVARLAEATRVPVHIHLLETPYQKVYAEKRSGGGVVRRLKELGALGPTWTLGHAVWVSEADIDQIARSGAAVCHNSSSNWRLRSGRTPLTELLDKGVRVAVGIDEAGINDDRDMLQELRVVLATSGNPGLSQAVVQPEQVFAMATRVGAATTGFGESTGSLEVGKSADMVLVDWSQIALPFLEQGVPVVEAVLRRGRAKHVRCVMVNGEVIYQEGSFVRVDRAEVEGKIAVSLATERSEEELDRERVATEMLPYVREYYSRWLADDAAGSRQGNVVRGNLR